jgi:hypothetical protein
MIYFLLFIPEQSKTLNMAQNKEISKLGENK